MTFYGAYRGPAWAAAGHGAVAAGAHAGDVAVAARHGVAHPADAHAHGHAQEDDHEVSHGPADAHAAPAAHAVHDQHAVDDAHGGHGHGPWHGPHESPRPMTWPLMALAAGAVVAGLFGIPAALGGSNAIEHFLEPSFTASSHAAAGESHGAPAGEAAEHGAEGEHAASQATELGLMLFSVLIAAAGILAARQFYVVSPETSERMAARWAGAHRVLSNKYYVDELYNSTVIGGTMGAGRKLWTVDRRVVDGAVNGSGWLTLAGSWLSGLTDRTIVDGAVNLVGWTAQESSYWFRRLQTGLVQNYALLMLFGVFAFVSIYLFVR
jgi:NADH-quinone oxidoreductase subunit L